MPDLGTTHILSWFLWPVHTSPAVPRVGSGMPPAHAMGLPADGCCARRTWGERFTGEAISSQGD